MALPCNVFETLDVKEYNYLEIRVTAGSLFDSLPMVSYYHTYSNFVSKMHRWRNMAT